VVPGLLLFEEFITEGEEVEVMAILDRAEQWDSTAVSRRLQHYGYVVE